MDWAAAFVEQFAMELVATLFSIALGVGVSVGRRSHHHPDGPSARYAVTYGVGLKIFSVVTTIVATGMTVVASRSTGEPAQAWLPWFFALMALSSAGLVWETFLCRHEVTPIELRHSSPWRGRYCMPWSSVTEVRFLPSMYVIEIEDAHGEKRWVSLTMSRLGLFAEHLLAGVPDGVITGRRTRELLRECRRGRLPELPI